MATRIRRKEGTFYFIACKGADLLSRVSFTSRYCFEGEQIDAEEPGGGHFAACRIIRTGLEQAGICTLSPLDIIDHGQYT